MAEEQAAVNQQLLQALQAITQQLQAQANAIAAIATAPPGAGAGAQPAAGGPTVFAETPAKINADAIIDYSTAAGIKVYNTASAKLPVTFDTCSVMHLPIVPISQVGTLVRAISSIFRTRRQPIVILSKSTVIS
jgi:hypothetical protein